MTYNEVYNLIASVDTKESNVVITKIGRASCRERV